ncbi:MAG: 30S ribosomal protein S1, partial [Clostridia bacterium]|nr:30S ribosomal protein S1 [Clostridia bacterium]
MTSIYKPEGYIIDTPENREYISSVNSLEYAKSAGIILEGRASLCDSSHNLVVDFGTFKGIIPKKEAAYSTDGSDIRDIAVITRVGKPVCFKVKSIEKNGSIPEIILSRRDAQSECFENYISDLKCGDIIDARIT